MKYSTGGGGEAEVICGPVDSLLLSSCWGGEAAGGGGGGGADGHFLDMEPDDDSSTKATMDALDSLLLTCGASGGGQGSSPQGSSHGAGPNANLAELKPLPPFTGYTGHLSINGIPGHHYHAIAAAPPQSPASPDPLEANNNSAHVANNNNNEGGGGGTLYKTSASSASTGATLYYTVTTTSAAEQAVVSSSTADGIKPEYMDYAQLLPPDIEDIAAIIGSAIADTTVASGEGVPGEDPAGSRDSWMDLGAWIDNACGGADTGGGAKAVISAETLQEFVANAQFVNAGPEQGVVASSTLHGLLTQSHNHHSHHHNHHHPHQHHQFHQPLQQHMVKREPGTHPAFSVQQSHMPLLQRRLQNGPPNGSVKQEPSYMSECTSPSSSTSYLSGPSDMILPHTTTASPPGQHVVSTTDNPALLMNGRYRAGYVRGGVKAGVASSPDLMLNGGGSPLDGLVSGSGLLHGGGGGNYPHTTTATTTTPGKSKSRNRSRKQQQQQHQQHQQQSLVYSADGSASLLGKEKPVHRCTICNRGFLNKSNIKVHLRTHTGEKPFKCEVCAKAFRQKAHLIKHQQIHKRVGRD